LTEEEKEEIYETTLQVLNLGYNLEDAKERLGNMVLINDLLEEPVKSDWSHLDDKIFPKHKQNTIDRLTREIKRRERRR
jgi:hypothetical protein